jgi:CHAT domain-containing protein
MATTTYERNDLALIAVTSGEATRLTCGERSIEVATSDLRTQLAARLRDLFGAVVLPPPTTEMPDHVALRRITMEIRSPELADLDWEAAVRSALGNQLTGTEAIVRVSPARLRALQIPLTFPIRVLDIADSGSVPHAGSDIHNGFRGADWSIAVEAGIASPRHAEDFVKGRRWPTVDILQWTCTWFHESMLSAVPYTGGMLWEGIVTLGWIEAVTALWQTRLLIIEGGPGDLPQLRRLAQRLIGRGGPAVWLTEPAKGTATFYEYFVHDRPLDFILSRHQPSAAPSLFAGGGREEALRFSPIGQALAHPDTAKAIRAAVKTVRRPRRPAPSATRRLMKSVLDSLARGVSLGALKGITGTGPTTWAIPASAEASSTLSVKLPQLDAMPETMDRLRFDDHESHGVLPLSHEVRNLQKAISPMLVKRAPADGTRHVNSAFYDIADGKPPCEIPQNGPPFRAGKTIHLGIQIGPQNVLTTTFGDTALVEEVFRWKADSPPVPIEIGVTALDFELLGDPVQQLMLPPKGESDFVTFALEPKAQTTMPGVARLRFALYYRNHLIQSFRMAALIDGPTAAAPRALADLLDLGENDDVTGLSWATRLEYASVAAIGNADALPARSLTIIANESAGEKVITAKADDFFDVAVNTTFPIFVDNARLALKKASMDANGDYLYFNENRGTDAQLETAMYDLAEAGWAAYATVFQKKAPREALQRKLEAGRSVIQAAHIDITKVIPWSLMYDREFDPRHQHFDDVLDPRSRVDVATGLCPAGIPDAKGAFLAGDCGTAPGCFLHPADNADRRKAGQPIYCPETVACPRRFWGFRYQIEAPAQQVPAGDEASAAASTVKATVPTRVFAAMNPHLAFTADHEKDLRKALAAVVPKATLAVDPVASDYAYIKQLLKSDALKAAIIYFYCHGRGEQKKADDPVLLSGLDFGANVTDNQALTGVDFDGDEWPDAPLVFMNGCDTAGFSPAAPSDLVTRFIHGRHASAVIGTEVTIWELLAGEMAGLFLKRFLAGTDAGKALLEARRELLAKRNPLGLVYTLYGSANLKLRYEA